MKTEYCVQLRSTASDEWIFCNIENSHCVTTPDIESANRTLEAYKRVMQNRKFRIAVRQVTDWCECKDAKIGEHK